jgi:hypothetical protein
LTRILQNPFLFVYWILFLFVERFSFEVATFGRSADPSGARGPVRSEATVIIMMYIWYFMTMYVLYFLMALPSFLLLFLWFSPTKSLTKIFCLIVERFVLHKIFCLIVERRVLQRYFVWLIERKSLTKIFCMTFLRDCFGISRPTERSDGKWSKCIYGILWPCMLCTFDWLYHLFIVVSMILSNKESYKRYYMILIEKWVGYWFFSILSYKDILYDCSRDWVL